MPADELSALAAINILIHYTKGGAFRLKGGIQSLPKMIVKKIKSLSQDVFFKERVEKIITKNGQAVSVLTEKKRQISAQHVISDIDLRTLVNYMLSKEDIEKEKIERINRIEISGSFVIVYLAVDLDVNKYNLCSSIGYFPSYDLKGMLNNNNETFFGLSIPTLVDPSLAPENKHIVIIHYPYAESSGEKKEDISSRLIKEVEKLIPELSKHIILRLSADAKTIMRYTANMDGAAYGWKQKPDLYQNIGFFRNLLDNLYIVGHWAGFGGGIMSSVVSAKKVVEKIIKKIK